MGLDTICPSFGAVRNTFLRAVFNEENFAKKFGKKAMISVWSAELKDPLLIFNQTTFHLDIICQNQHS